MNTRIFRILSLTLIAFIGLYAIYSTYKTNTLEAQLKGNEKALAEMKIAMTSQNELEKIDSLLVDGEDYNGALKAYQDKFQGEEAQRNEQLKWRMALTEKLMALKNEVHNNLKANISQEDEIDEESLASSEKQLNQRDSLHFELEKAKVQLARMKRQLNNKSQGEYLTFKTPKGTKLHYVGQVKNGKASGYGVAILSSGSRYQGYWKNNQRNGVGTFYWSDGEYYVGEYENDQRNGEGTYYWPNGEKYVGNWKDDKRYGQGEFYAKDGSIIAKGTWKDDKLVSNTRVKKQKKSQKVEEVTASL